MAPSVQRIQIVYVIYTATVYSWWVINRHQNSALMIPVHAELNACSARETAAVSMHDTPQSTCAVVTPRPDAEHSERPSRWTRWYAVYLQATDESPHHL